MLGNFSCFYYCLLRYFKINFFKNSVSNTIRVPNSLGLTIWRSWSGSKLLANVISRWQKSPQGRNELYQTFSCLQFSMQNIEKSHDLDFAYRRTYQLFTFIVCMASTMYFYEFFFWLAVPKPLLEVKRIILYG